MFVLSLSWQMIDFEHKTVVQKRRFPYRSWADAVCTVRVAADQRAGGQVEPLAAQRLLRHRVDFAPRPVREQVCVGLQKHVSFQRFLCLSRACLGKHSGFSTKWRLQKRTTFPHLIARDIGRIFRCRVAVEVAAADDAEVTPSASPLRLRESCSRAKSSSNKMTQSEKLQQ